MNFDQLAFGLIFVTPTQCADGLIGQLTTTVIDLAVALERTVKSLSRAMHMQHQILRGVPGVHQHAAKWHLLDLSCIIKHVLHVRELRFGIAVWCVHTPIHDPVAMRLGVDVQAVDNTNAFNQSVRIAAVLQSNQLDFV